MGCLATECHVRSMFVIPENDQVQLSAKRLVAKWHQMQLAKNLFQCQDEAFHHSDASVLSHSAISGWFDSFVFGPPSKCVAVEGALAVTNDVFGRSSHATHRSSQAGADGTAIRPLGKDAARHGATGKMIHSNQHPPAKRPTLG